MSKNLGCKLPHLCVYPEEKVSFGTIVWLESDVAKCDPDHCQEFGQVPFLAFFKHNKPIEKGITSPQSDMYACQF